MQNEKILAYLEGSCLGKANRASGTELERTLHISGTCLRKQVNRLRCKEHPIASDRSGYFYATNAGEVYDTIRQLKQMVSGLEAAISGLERSMERFREHGEVGHGYTYIITLSGEDNKDASASGHFVSKKQNEL